MESNQAQQSSQNIGQLEGTGAYGPLLLVPVEGLGGPSGPLPSRVCFQRLYSKRRAWNATAEYTRAGSEEPIRPPF